MGEYLIESALLTHGLKSLSAKDLMNKWPEKNKKIVWLEKGVIQIGGIDKFCAFREQAQLAGRINYRNCEEKICAKQTGVFTASGAMKVCEQLGMQLVVTCGIGGLEKGGNFETFNDGVAMRESSVSVVATSPKDMFDLSYTLLKIREAGVGICGRDETVWDGYLFAGVKVVPDCVWSGEKVKPQVLYLQPISAEKKLAHREILKKAIEYGRQAEQRGEAFHPAVNGVLDELTAGKSSRIQYDSLIENIRWAEQLTEE